MGVVMFQSLRSRSIQGLTVAAALAGALFSTPASANLLFPFQSYGQSMQQYEPRGEDEGIADPSRFKRQVVDYRTNEAAGTVIIDTPHTYLYFVLGNGKAIRYGIGGGSEGFSWAGVKQIAKKTEWPGLYRPQ